MPRAFSRGLEWPRRETDYVNKTSAEDRNLCETLLQFHTCLLSIVLYLLSTAQIYVYFSRTACICLPLSMKPVSSAQRTSRVEVKVKYTLVQPLRLCTGRTAHWGTRGIALLFVDHGTRRG